jgi:predicted HicB family RNase H-like nuclease
MSKKRQKIPKYKQVRISATLHRQLKIEAALDEIKVSALAERILRKALSMSY